MQCTSLRESIGSNATAAGGPGLTGRRKHTEEQPNQLNMSVWPVCLQTGTKWETYKAKDGAGRATPVSRKKKGGSNNGRQKRGQHHLPPSFTPNNPPALPPPPAALPAPARSQHPSHCQAKHMMNCPVNRIHSGTN